MVAFPEDRDPALAAGGGNQLTVVGEVFSKGGPGHFKTKGSGGVKA
jgi:hypothetical protein